MRSSPSSQDVDATVGSRNRSTHFPLSHRTESPHLRPMRLLPILTALLVTAATALSAEAPVRHVVSFKFKKDAAPADVRKVEEAFAALKSKIPQIQSLEWGTNLSGENLDKGFTHMWVLTFADTAAVKTYIDHPDHQAFVKLLKPSLEEAFVIDFQPRR